MTTTTPPSREDLSQQQQQQGQQPHELINFEVSETLKQSRLHIKRIGIKRRDRCFVIKYSARRNTRDGESALKNYDQLWKHGEISVQITGDVDADMTALRRNAKDEFSDFFLDDQVDYDVDMLVMGVRRIYTNKEQYGGAYEYTNKIRKQQLKALEKVEEKEEESGKLKKIYTQKYYSTVEGLLYESVLVGGVPKFVSIEVEVTTTTTGGGGDLFPRFYDKILLPEHSDKPTTELLPPPDKESYLSKPYSFASEQELEEGYIRRIIDKGIDLDYLYRKVKDTAKKYIDGSDTHLTMVAADTVLSYFMDKLGQVHYLFFYGDNDTGKSANLKFMSWTAYRALYNIDITPANIYTYLGLLQESQGVILEDEADNIDRNWEKMKIYKSGYNSGSKVTRTDLSFGRKQDSFFVYGFKAFTAERRPDPDRAKGFNERNFYIECQRGSPQYDINEIISAAAGDPEFLELQRELEDLHKLLFVYRLMHHGEVLPDIKNLSVRNREKQVVKPLLRLFQKAECRGEISQALTELIINRRGAKRDTLDAKIYQVIKKLIEDNGGEIHRFTNTLVFAAVCESLEGKYKNEGKDQSFETPEHGFVSHKKISQICKDKFGADNKPRQASTRTLTFDPDKLAKVKDAYDLGDELKLLIEESDITRNDRCDTCDTSGGDQGVFSQDQSDENSKEPYTNPINDNENMQKLEEKRDQGEAATSTEVPQHPKHLSQVSQVSLSNLEDSSNNNHHQQQQTDKQQLRFLKCPICKKFESIYQESIAHHMRLTHGVDQT